MVYMISAQILILVNCADKESPIKELKQKHHYKNCASLPAVISMRHTTINDKKMNTSYADKDTKALWILQKRKWLTLLCWRRAEAWQIHTEVHPVVAQAEASSSHLSSLSSSFIIIYIPPLFHVDMNQDSIPKIQLLYLTQSWADYFSTKSSFLMSFLIHSWHAFRGIPLPLSPAIFILLQSDIQSFVFFCWPHNCISITWQYTLGENKGKLPVKQQMPYSVQKRLVV